MARFIIAIRNAAKKTDVFDGSIIRRTIFDFGSLDLSSSAIHSCLIHFLVGV